MPVKLSDHMRVFVLGIILLCGFCAAALQAQTNSVPAITPPTIMREFRGAWVATVSNIDWPSKPGLPVEQQKAELIAILDKAVELRLNAIIFQVRPACDALYSSSLEPWSEYLTGKMGQAPAPFYDPLEFAVAEAHERGLELHAWFNPYRAGHPSRKSPASANHISKRSPGLVRQYGKYLWLDPGDTSVQDYTTRVILDVVKRYDIDGVHIDDYFYPYKERNAKGDFIEFPDEKSWRKYREAGGKLARADWRRENVNKLIERLYREIKGQKKWVKFGVSPFGIWRPGHPQQIQGLDAYEHLYADARHWLAKGWLDYLAPQLYWAITPPQQSYPVLLDWWHSQNDSKRVIWPGGAVTRVGSNQWKAEEILQQIEISRKSPTPGHIHWNMSTLLKNPDNLGEKLVQNVYSEPAIAPTLEWLQPPVPQKPAILVKDEANGEKLVSWKGGEDVTFWVVQSRQNGKWKTEVVPARKNFFRFAARLMPEAIAITGFNRFRAASPTALLGP